MQLNEKVWVDIFLHPDYIIYLTFSVANNTLRMTLMYTDIRYYYRKTTRARHRHTRRYYDIYMVIYENNSFFRKNGAMFK